MKKESLRLAKYSKCGLFINGQKRKGGRLYKWERLIYRIRIYLGTMWPLNQYSLCPTMTVEEILVKGRDNAVDVA